MGSNSSQEVKKNEGEVNNSSGFHLFEIHMPTAGKGLILIIIISIAAYLLYKWRKRCAASSRSSPTALPQWMPMSGFPTPGFPTFPTPQPFPMTMFPQAVSFTPQQQRFQPGTIEEVAEEQGKSTTQENPESSARRPAFRYQNQDP